MQLRLNTNNHMGIWGILVMNVTDVTSEGCSSKMKKDVQNPTLASYLLYCVDSSVVMALSELLRSFDLDPSGRSP